MRTTVEQAKHDADHACVLSLLSLPIGQFRTVILNERCRGNRRCENIGRTLIVAISVLHLSFKINILLDIVKIWPIIKLSKNSEVVMAENETLDLRFSRRWFSVFKAILGNPSPEVVAEQFLRTLQRGWQKAQQQMLKHGTSLDEVIETTINMENVDPLYRLTKRHEYVKLFELEQRPFDSHDSLLERVVSASAERVLDQFRDHLVGKAICPTVGDWNKLEAALMRPIAGDIARFAGRLASRPEVAVRVPAAFALSGAQPAPAQSFVHMSLLNTLASEHTGAR
jgi:hypothetical protein